jgi:hypothetical protein
LKIQNMTQVRNGSSMVRSPLEDRKRIEFIPFFLHLFFLYLKKVIKGILRSPTSIRDHRDRSMNQHTKY